MQCEAHIDYYTLLLLLLITRVEAGKASERASHNYCTLIFNREIYCKQLFDFSIEIHIFIQQRRGKSLSVTSYAHNGIHKVAGSRPQVAARQHTHAHTQTPKMSGQGNEFSAKRGEKVLLLLHGSAQIWYLLHGMHDTSHTRSTCVPHWTPAFHTHQNGLYLRLCLKAIILTIHLFVLTTTVCGKKINTPKGEVNSIMTTKLNICHRIIQIGHLTRLVFDSTFPVHRANATS